MSIPVKPIATLASKIGSVFSKGPSFQNFGKGPIARIVSKPFRMGEEAVRGFKGTTDQMPDYSQIGYGQGIWGAAGQHKGAQVLGGLMGGGLIYGGSRFARGDQVQQDHAGTVLQGHDPEAVKNRQKFVATKMGNAKSFNRDMYNGMVESQPWVKTAIDALGEDRYMEYRDAIASRQEGATPQKLHDLLVHSFASVASPEEMKNVGKEAYVLPGLFTSDGRKRKVLVMNPTKNSKTGEQKFDLLDFDTEAPQQ